MNDAKEHYAAADFDAAYRSFAAAAAMARSGPKGRLGRSLLSMAGCDEVLGRFGRAASTRLEAEAIAASEPASEAFRFDALNGAALALAGAGEDDRAAETVARLTALASTAFGETHELTLRSRLTTATVARLAGRADAARKAIDRLEDSFDGAKVSERLEFDAALERARCELASGSFESALAALGRAERLTDGDGQRFEIEGLRAIILRTEGRYRDSIAAFEGALAHHRARGGESIATASLLGELALALALAGRPAEAAAAADQGRALARLFIPEMTAVRAQIDMNAVTALTAVGHATEAARVAYEVTRTLPDDGPRARRVRWQARTAMVPCLVADRRFDEARAAAAAVVADASAVGASPNDRLKAGYALGICERHLGRHAEALAIFATAEAAAGKEIDRTAQALLTAEKAACHRALGKYGDAERLYRSALALAPAAAEDEIGRISARFGRMVLKELGRPEEAVALFERATGALDDLHDRALAAPDTERGAVLQAANRYQAYDGLAEALDRSGRRDEALDRLERGRARILLDLIDRGRFDALSEVERRAAEQSDSVKLEKVRSIRSALENAERRAATLTWSVAALAARTDLDADRKAAEGARLGGELEAAIAARRLALRERGLMVAENSEIAETHDIGRIRRRLAKDEAILYFSLTEWGARAYLVPPPGGVIASFDLVAADGAAMTIDTIARLVKAHRAQIDGSSDLQREVGASAAAPAWVETGRRLFQSIVPEMLWTALKARTLVYLVPHGPLNDLVFETLVTAVPAPGTAAKVWLDDGPALAYVPSGSVLDWALARRDRRERRAPKLDLLALGDPVFSATTTSERAAMPSKGVVVLVAPPASPAARAGVRVGDVILSLGGSAIDDRDSWKETENRSEPTTAASRPSSLRIWRDGSILDLAIAPGPLGLGVRSLADAAESRATSLPSPSPLERGITFPIAPLRPLPGTRREVESLTASVSAPRPDGTPGALALALLGAEATETRFFAEAPTARRVHVATHMLRDERLGADQNRLAFTLPETPTESDDGFVSLADLLARWRDRLSACELLTLSACETRRGETIRDEGVFSMPWGFFYAGASAVVASQWRVADDSTADLMSRFYAELGRAPSKIAAFTTARRAIRARLPHPYFWAPFVFMGDPR